MRLLQPGPALNQDAYALSHSVSDACHTEFLLVYLRKLSDVMLLCFR